MSDLPFGPTLVKVVSSMDGREQPCNLWASKEAGAKPLLVSLHTWGGAYDQKSYSYVGQGIARGWHCIMPHFRGPNVQPEACGSPLARQDILDAVDWAKANLNVDPGRVYLVGGSGGGHMTMRTVSHAPHVFAAASAWCGISDLAAWYREHVKDGVVGQYAQDIHNSVGGVPGSSAEVDRQIVDRSPVHHITRATHVPLDLAHGIHDGKTGSVPFWHSIWAFNRIAQAIGSPVVTQQEIDELWHQGKLSNPGEEDTQPDPAYGGRAIYLRRHAGPCRLTIFEGGHDALSVPAAAWVERYSLRGPVEPQAMGFALPGDGGASVIAG